MLDTISNTKEVVAGSFRKTELSNDPLFFAFIGTTNKTKTQPLVS